MPDGIGQRIVAILGGVLVLIFGLILAQVVIDTVVTAVTHASIGSFAGASALGGLIPFVYFAAILGIGVGLMAIGFGGFAGRGPMGVFVLPAAVAFTAYPLAFISAAVVVLYVAYYIQRRYSFRRQHQLAA